MAEDDAVTTASYLEALLLQVFEGRHILRSSQAVAVAVAGKAITISAMATISSAAISIATIIALSRAGWVSRGVGHSGPVRVCAIAVVATICAIASICAIAIPIAEATKSTIAIGSIRTIRCKQLLFLWCHLLSFLWCFPRERSWGGILRPWVQTLNRGPSSPR